MSVFSTVGPVLIGSCVSCWATGIVVSLAATYFSRFPKDRTWIRVSVVVATLWSFVDSAIICSWAYKWGVQYFVQPQELMRLPWELTGWFLKFTALVLVQHFFLFRLWTVSKGNWLLTGGLSALALASYGIALYMTAYTLKHNESILAMADIQFGGVLVTDFGITASLLYYLIVKPQRRTGEGMRVHSPFRRLITKSLQTNAISAVLQLAIIVIYARYPSSFFYFYIAFMEQKAYAGSMIATLNARNPQNDGSFTSPSSFGLSSSASSSRSRPKGFGSFFPSHANAQALQVSVRREVEVDEETAVNSGGGSYDLRENKKGGEASPFRVKFSGGRGGQGCAREDRKGGGKGEDIELDEL
ncbi:hypothetical protein JCM8547_006648 [Rhodosporidiobolus lusitaniae]